MNSLTDEMVRPDESGARQRKTQYTNKKRIRVYPRPRYSLKLIVSTVLLMVSGMGVAQTEYRHTDAEEQHPSGMTELPPSVVTGQRYNAEAGAGFFNTKVELGPLGSRALLDTPYTVNVLSSDMIKNVQASSLVDLLKYIPLAQMEARGGLDVGRPQTRGMESSVVANNRLDGFNIAGTTAYPMELFERVEVIASLTGALYGPASPAGNFNFISKRPTQTPLRRLTVGYGSKGRTGFHADLGGHVGPGGALGYRANLLHEEGEGFVSHSRLRRNLVGLAFDLNFTDSTVLEINANYYEFLKRGYPGGFSYSATRRVPSAPDPTKVGFGQSGLGLDLETTTGTMKLKHRFNQDWTMAVGVSRQIVDRQMDSPTNTLDDDYGNYTTTVSSSVAGRFTINSNQLHLNGKVMTGSVHHDLVLGSTGYEWKRYSALESRRFTLGQANIRNPARFPKPENMLYSGRRYLGGYDRQQAYIFGDTVTFNDRWSVLMVASYSSLESKSYNTDGDTVSTYKKYGWSPTVALMFKPVNHITTYVAYADSLQQGDTAPSENVANPGESLKPYRSEQWELGAKGEFGGITAAAALFRIERPFAYASTDDNIFREQGKQVNHGLELSASGEVTNRLFIYGGVLFLDPRLRDTVKETTRDKRVVGAAKIQANLLAEYSVPGVPGLVLSGNVHHTGRRAANDTNSQWVDGYTTLDLGARYSMKTMGKDTIWRLTVNNVTNRRYWASIFPGNINGTNSSASAFMGTPREVLLSVSVDL